MALMIALRMFVLFASVLLAGQQSVVRTADPAKRGLKDGDIPRVVKVAENVYTYEDFHSGAEKFTTNSLIVVTKDEVLVADGQGSVAATKGLVDAIAKITPAPITHVVIASDHGDHTGGNAAFPANVKYFIHPTSQAILKGPAGAELVTDKKILTLGGDEIQILFLGRAHTGGDLTVWLPRQKILFMSETFLNRVFPAMRSAYPSEWVAAVDKALAMNASIYIPGHGFTETGPVSREELVAYRAALVAVIAEATRLYKAGVPVADAPAQAKWGEYASWTLASSQGPIAIRKVYEELAGK
jgi:cyclase